MESRDCHTFLRCGSKTTTLEHVHLEHRGAKPNLEKPLPELPSRGQCADAGGYGHARWETIPAQGDKGQTKQLFHQGLIVTSTHLSTFLSWTFGTVLNLCFLK